MGRIQTLGPPLTLLPISYMWVSFTQGGDWLLEGGEGSVGIRFGASPQG